jgi:AcrR family transcriptional regulator
MTGEHETTRQAILHTAEKSFAARGFDGARVDEIARETGVNQATIYYYFKSKEELFNAVIEARLADAQKFRQEMKEVRPEPEILSRQVLDFVLEQRDFLKILMLETLTSSSSNHWIFRLMDFIRTAPSDSEEPAVEKKHWKLAWFYFAMFPAAAFSVFHEQWSDYFKTDLDDDKDCFARSLKSCTGALREAIRGSSKDGR